MGVGVGTGLGKIRWVVERGLAWVHAFKRLQTGYERRTISISACSNSPAS